MTGAPAYPFTALVGQPLLKQALLLNAVNPKLGGVLIRGQKGTAKSTAARALATLLPALAVVDGCRFACDPSPDSARCAECRAREMTSGGPLPESTRPAAFVDLPIGATEDRVLGTLDLEHALQRGERQFEPGLLARANRGLLYVDEVNLLPDHLVDVLLDAAAMGVNTVERESVSFSHPAAFILVGTMNPEEGELRPQLLDRFALAVDVSAMTDPLERSEVVRRRIAFEVDPKSFAARWLDHQEEERARIAQARELLSRVVLDDALLLLIARICTELEVDGLRGDLVMYRTAVTLAAYEGRLEVTVDDIRRAAELALPHRRRRQPFDEPGMDSDKLEQLVQDHLLQQEASPSDEADAASEQVFEPEAASLPMPKIEQPRVRGHIPVGRSGATVESPRGRHIRSVPASAGESRPLDLRATLIAAARRSRTPGSQVRVGRDDIRIKIRQSRAKRLTLFVVDASGSMAARRRMAAVKGAVLALLLQAYQQRDEVGVIAFRGARADVLLPPTRSVHLASTRLRALPTGGRTPLAAALRTALTMLSLARDAASRLVVLVSDGRGNVALTPGGDAQADALTVAHALRASGISALVVDSEEGQVRLGLARQLCAALQGHYVRLGELQSVSGAGSRNPLATAVRRLHAIDSRTGPVLA
jgi:magnesium chelatase subunit D